MEEDDEHLPSSHHVEVVQSQEVGPSEAVCACQGAKCWANLPSLQAVVHPGVAYVSRLREAMRQPSQARLQVEGSPEVVYACCRVVEILVQLSRLPEEVRDALRGEPHLHWVVQDALLVSHWTLEEDHVEEDDVNAPQVVASHQQGPALELGVPGEGHGLGPAHP